MRLYYVEYHTIWNHDVDDSSMVLVKELASFGLTSRIRVRKEAELEAQHFKDLNFTQCKFMSIHTTVHLFGEGLHKEFSRNIWYAGKRWVDFEQDIPGTEHWAQAADNSQWHKPLTDQQTQAISKE